MFSTEFAEFSDKKYIILKRFLYSNPLSPVWEPETLPAVAHS